MNLGENLKKLRLQKGISQTDLAKEFNIARSTLSQYESNQRTPSDEMKLRFCKYFNVSLDYLLGNPNINASTNFSSNDNEVTVALHSDFEYDDLPDEARKEIDNFIEFVKQKYKDK